MFKFNIKLIIILLYYKEMCYTKQKSVTKLSLPFYIFNKMFMYMVLLLLINEVYSRHYVRGHFSNRI